MQMVEISIYLGPHTYMAYSIIIIPARGVRLLQVMNQHWHIIIIQYV